MGAVHAFDPVSATAQARVPAWHPSGPAGVSVADALVGVDFLDDPYPAYRRLREAAPVHYSEAFFQGAWLVTRHADVEQALRDPRLSSQRTAGWVKRVEGFGADRLFQQTFGRALVFLDAPEHPRVRQVLAAGFHPGVVAGLSSLVQQVAQDLLDAVDARTGFDFVHALARPLPSRVTAALLGIDPADERDFLAWSDHLATFIGAPQPDRHLLQAAQKSLLQMTRYFRALLPARRAAPADDLVSRLVQAEATGQIASTSELLAQCAMLLLAGHETTRNLLANGLHALLGHPVQWARLQADPGLLPGAVRELLRYDSPVQYTGRRVITGFELHGCRLRRGELVLALIGAANRDPGRFRDPDALDIARADGGFLSFGRGAHVCLGSRLALMQAEVVFRAVLQRWPALCLDSTPARRNRNAALRGFASLPVRCGQPRP